jgi:hypothetical protein
MEKVYIEISPAVAATHLYMMRKFIGHDMKIPGKDLTIPAPGTPTYSWAFYGDPNLTDEQIDEIIRKRKPRKKPDTTGQPTSNPGDSEA